MKHLQPFGQYGGTKYWGNFAAGILPICTVTKRILLGFRGLEANEPHTWGLFGGKLDDDEDASQLQEVALRELYEETRYRGEIKLLPAYVYKDTSHKFEYHNYIGLVNEEFKTRLNWENEKTEWFTYQQVLDLKYDLHFGVSKWINDLPKYYPEIL